MKSGMSHPNKVQACKRSSVPAIRPPAAIARIALLFDDAAFPVIECPFISNLQIGWTIPGTGRKSPEIGLKDSE